MAQPIIFPATGAAAAPFPLLEPHTVGPAAMLPEIEEIFGIAGVQTEGREAEVVSAIQDLGRLSNEWNAVYYDQILFNHARHYGSAGGVIERLFAERDFFNRLYTPSRRFRIYPVDEYDFNDGSLFPTIVFEAGRRVFGCADFNSFPEAIVLDYIQGMSGATSNEQAKRLGGTWFELFMSRALEAYDHLRDIGVGLMLRIEDEHFMLPRMVRDRYFHNHPDESGKFYHLNPNRTRVREILGGEGLREAGNA